MNALDSTFPSPAHSRESGDHVSRLHPFLVALPTKVQLLPRQTCPKQKCMANHLVVDQFTHIASTTHLRVRISERQLAWRPVSVAGTPFTPSFAP
jgi:hypothetical protein